MFSRNSNQLQKQQNFRQQQFIVLTIPFSQRRSLELAIDKLPIPQPNFYNSNRKQERLQRVNLRSRIRIHPQKIGRWRRIHLRTNIQLESIQCKTQLQKISKIEDNFF